MNKTKTILISGLVAGTADGIAAILLFAHPANLHNIGRVFRFIAGGLLGHAAFSSGVIYPLIGLCLHYLIATIWSGVYLLLLYRSFKPGSVIVKMILFACMIWIGMNGFVMPLFGMGASTTNGWAIMRSFTTLLVCVSLPVCLIAEKRA